MNGKEQKPDSGGKASKEKASSATPASTGLAVIHDCVKTLPAKPGVYRMTGKGDKVLYVGKAKNLRKRLAAYTKPDGTSVRIRRMIAGTATVEVLSTHTEAAGLLEQVSNDGLGRFYTPDASGVYYLTVRNDVLESFAAKPGTFMIIESIRTDEWHERWMEGKVDEEP